MTYALYSLQPYFKVVQLIGQRYDFSLTIPNNILSFFKKKNTKVFYALVFF